MRIKNGGIMLIVPNMEYFGCIELTHSCLEHYYNHAIQLGGYEWGG